MRSQSRNPLGPIQMSTLFRLHEEIWGIDSTGNFFLSRVLMAASIVLYFLISSYALHGPIPEFGS